MVAAFVVMRLFGILMIAILGRRAGIAVAVVVMILVRVNVGALVVAAMGCCVHHTRRHACEDAETKEEAGNETHAGGR